MLDGGGGVAVFGSFAVVVAALMTFGIGGCHRRTVPPFCRFDLAIFHVHNSLMDIVVAVDSFGLKNAVDHVADGSLVGELAVQLPLRV